MADELPEPKSRKESYLAKAAGMSVDIPEPESREEQYLNAIANGGGGGGGGSDFNDLTNRPKYNGQVMTGNTDIPEEFKVITDDDVNWQDPQTGDSYVALWLLPAGKYTIDPNIDANICIDTALVEDEDYYTVCNVYDFSYGGNGVIIIDTVEDETVVYISIFGAKDNSLLTVNDKSTGTSYDEPPYWIAQQPFVGTNGDYEGSSGLVPAPTTADVDKFLKSDGTWANAGGSSYKTLTEADYNWNSVDKTTTGTLDSIAPWLLDDGFYYVDNTVYVAQTNSFNKATNTVYARKSFMVFKDPELNGISTGILLYSPEHSYGQPLFLPYTNNGSFQLGSIDQGVLLNRTTIKNNLTTTSSNLVLDARQGKVLNDKITPSSGASAPTTSTVGELGKIYIDTTNDDAYMCVNVNGSTYTWKKITP